MLVLASLVLGFAIFDALSRFMVVWLHPTPTRPCLGVTIWDASSDAESIRVYRSLFFRSVQSYPYHACLCHLLAYIHLYTLAYMSMCESCLLVCRPCFNTMKLWTPDPNLHLSLVDTTFCLLSCLFAFLLSCLVVYLMARHVSCHMLCLPCLSCLSALCLFHTLFASFPFIACLLVSCLCLCMYRHGARTHGARERSPRRKQKGQGCKHVDISQVAMFSRFKGLATPIWFCTL